MEDNNLNEQHRHGKKKKKKSFMQYTKKCGRKGEFGKGKRLSEEEFNYYLRVFKEIKTVEEDEKYALVRNFFREVNKNGEQRNLACNQVVSFILDKLLPLASSSIVLELCKSFQEDMRALFVDPYASHVFQTLLNLSLKFIQSGATYIDPFDEDSEGKGIPVPKEEQEELKMFILKTSKFAYNNLDEYIKQTHASYILRTIIEVCSGIKVSDSIKMGSKFVQNNTLKDKQTDLLLVPSELKAVLKDFLVRLQKLPDLPNIIWYESGSTVVQSALLVSEQIEKEECERLAQHVIEHGVTQLGTDFDYETSMDVENVFLNQPSSRLLEVVLSCASIKQQDHIYNKLFKDQFKDLVKHPKGNFAVKHLLSTWKCKETFSDLYEGIVPVLPSAFKCGYYGVVLALIQGCQKLNCQQSRCLYELMKLLECYEPESKQLKIATLTLYMLPDSKYEEKQSKNELKSVLLQGSLILQELLNFQKPIKVINSILDMNDGDILTMATSPQGSHVIDSFVSSQTVGEKSRYKLLHRLKGSLSTLACSKHGSRSLESLWNICSVKHKAQICSELLQSSDKLKNNSFGKIIYNKFQIELYKRSGNSEDWQELQNKVDKKRSLFSDILNENTNAEDIESQPKKKKKKKDKNE